MRNRTRHLISMLITLALLAVVALHVSNLVQPGTALADDWRSHLILMASTLPEPQASKADSRPAKSQPAAAVHAESLDPPARSRRGGPDRLNPEMIDRCLEVANDIDPDLARELAKKREKNPDEFDQTMRQGNSGRSLMAMAQLKHRDPDLYQLKIGEMSQSLQINRVAAKLQEAMASSDQRSINSLTEQLRHMLQIQMAMSLKARGEYLCRIEEQVKTLREEIEHDAENFNRIVEGRLNGLIQQPPATDLNAVIPASSPSPQR